MEKAGVQDWKRPGNSTHVVRLRHQRAFLSIEGVSDPGLDWVRQKLERTQKTGWPSSTEVHTSLFVKNSPPIKRGASEIGRRPRAKRAARNLKKIEWLSTYRLSKRPTRKDAREPTPTCKHAKGRECQLPQVQRGPRPPCFAGTCNTSKMMEGAQKLGARLESWSEPDTIKERSKKKLEHTQKKGGRLRCRNFTRCCRQVTLRRHLRG